MREIIDKKENFINKVCSTDAITAKTVQNRSKRAAAAQTTTPPITLTTTMHSNALKETDCQKQLNQSVIEAQEGATKGIKAIVNSDVLDTFLRNTDGLDWKVIDGYSLHDVITVILDGINQPTTMSIHE